MARLVFRHCGALLLLLWAADNLLGKRLPLRIMIVRRHPAAFLRTVALDNPAGLAVRVATPAELQRATAAEPPAMTREFVEAALRKGDSCVAVFDGPDIAAFSWNASAPTRLFGDVWIGLGDRYLYGYNAATLPRHRGKGLHALSINYTGKYLAAPHGKGVVAVLGARNAKALVSEARVSPLQAEVAVLWIGRRRVRAWVSRSGRDIGLRFTLGDPVAHA